MDKLTIPIYSQDKNFIVRLPLDFDKNGNLYINGEALLEYIKRAKNNKDELENCDCSGNCKHKYLLQFLEFPENDLIYQINIDGNNNIVCERANYDIIKSDDLISFGEDFDKCQKYMTDFNTKNYMSDGTIMYSDGSFFVECDGINIEDKLPIRNNGEYPALYQLEVVNNENKCLLRTEIKNEEEYITYKVKIINNKSIRLIIDGEKIKRYKLIFNKQGEIICEKH